MAWIKFAVLQTGLSEILKYIGKEKNIRHGIHPLISYPGFSIYRKIPKISPGAYIFQRPFLRGLFLRFKTDRARFIVGSKFTVFALFYFVFGGNFPSTSPRGAYIWRGDLTEGFLCYRFGGLIFGGAYTWRGLFSEFYGICCMLIQLISQVFITQHTIKFVFSGSCLLSNLLKLSI